MKNRGAGGQRQPPHIYPRVVQEYGSAYNVSTNTPLPIDGTSGWKDLGSDYRSLTFFFENQDGTRSAFLIVETSHGGSKPADPSTRFEVKPSTEGWVTIDAGDNPFTNFRVSAETDSALGYPTIVGRFSVVGMPR
jgi:hypothetical protein